MMMKIVTNESIKIGLKRMQEKLFKDALGMFRAFTSGKNLKDLVGKVTAGIVREQTGASQPTAWAPGVAECFKT